MSIIDISSLYSYYIYRNLTQSLLLRKKGNVNFFAENSGAMLLWGPSVFIGGDFSKANGEKVISVLGDFDTPRYLYYPNDTWCSFIKNAFLDKLKDRYLNVYQFDYITITEFNEKIECIVPVTRDFIENNLPNTELITDELYSYTDIEDFFQNGFGLALIIDGRFFIDWYWVGHTKAWLIPNTEDLKPYIPRNVLIRKWLGTIVGYPIIAAVIAGIMTLI